MSKLVWRHFPASDGGYWEAFYNEERVVLIEGKYQHTGQHFVRIGYRSATNEERAAVITDWESRSTSSGLLAFLTGAPEGDSIAAVCHLAGCSREEGQKLLARMQYRKREFLEFLQGLQETKVNPDVVITGPAEVRG